MTVQDKAAQILAEAREGIDAVDAQMHACLIKRAELVDRVARAKTMARMDVTPLRPAREMQILRRLQQNHHGPLPFHVLPAIWRQIIGAATAMQAPIEIGVYAQGEAADLFALGGLVLEHFGASVRPVLRYDLNQLMRELTNGTLQAVVVPRLVFAEETLGEWWRACLDQSAERPKIVAVLPQIGARHEAYVIARAPLEATVDDITVLGVYFDTAQSRSGLTSRIAGSEVMAMGKTSCLLAVQGFYYARDDIAELAKTLNTAPHNVVLAGVFPQMIRSEEESSA